MKIAIDAVGIRDGGGAAVLVEVLNWLPIVRPLWKWDVYMLEEGLRSFRTGCLSEQISLIFTHHGNTGLGRLFWVYVELPRRLSGRKMDLLFSFANIGSSRPKHPQVIFLQQLLAFNDAGKEERSILRGLRLRILQSAVRNGIPNSEALIVQTESMRERVITVFPEVSRKISVIPSGIRSLSPSPFIRPEVASLIAHAGRPRLLYIASLAPHKNHYRLLKAFRLLLAVYPEASLILTIDLECSGGQESLRRKLLQVLDYDLKRHVFCVGALTFDEVNYAFGNSDLMVFPSLAESFGLPLVEAMACGCPIAAADLPYAHDVAGDAAVYFDSTDEKDMAICLGRALSNEVTLKNLRSAAAIRVKKFSYRNIAEDIASVLEKAHVRWHDKKSNSRY